MSGGRKGAINMSEHKHCCQFMDCFLGEEESTWSTRPVEIGYSSPLREYYVGPRQPPEVVDHQGQVIFYCPWCSKKMPSSLRSEYGRVLEGQFQIEFWSEVEKAPLEFKTDAWWKNREVSVFHCCEDMVRYIYDDIAIHYDPDTDEYGIYKQAPADALPDSYKKISACPWCGGSLPVPEGLRKEFRIVKI
jgi:hypothetical protein